MIGEVNLDTELNKQQKDIVLNYTWFLVLTNSMIMVFRNILFNNKKYYSGQAWFNMAFYTIWCKFLTMPICSDKLNI